MRAQGTLEMDFDMQVVRRCVRCQQAPVHIQKLKHQYVIRVGFVREQGSDRALPG